MSTTPAGCGLAQPGLVLRDNLADRIAEAGREGWLGEIEGLKVSLAAAKDKLTQMDAHSKSSAGDLPGDAFVR
ncbi:hypothetical protein [Streptomyces sp. TRM68367]|uniref:hypothetical protein n=1 Tax=Streptomyces sp. TRM68367 TaxID=2758415 RepID=UPI00165B78F1|nr:hypothetical protein [Streptomyces sp. TRM68367]MBC9730308.1 hypothetical protein [Streptomyces sp. TRM68367]